MVLDVRFHRRLVHLYEIARFAQVTEYKREIRRRGIDGRFRSGRFGARLMRRVLVRSQRSPVRRLEIAHAAVKPVLAGVAGKVIEERLGVLIFVDGLTKSALVREPLLAIFRLENMHRLDFLVIVLGRLFDRFLPVLGRHSRDQNLVLRMNGSVVVNDELALERAQSTVALLRGVDVITGVVLVGLGFLLLGRRFRYLRRHRLRFLDRRLFLHDPFVDHADRPVVASPLLLDALFLDRFFRSRFLLFDDLFFLDWLWRFRQLDVVLGWLGVVWLYFRCALEQRARRDGFGRDRFRCAIQVEEATSGGSSRDRRLGFRVGIGARLRRD
uniref:Uncharacterized protein n=1 Tax=Photinus pyralis TaxID=7054 RepID=A0A1Y1N478_PHOPY